jgi:alpha-tubulin suppressor-like RCC1 family protein
MHTAALTQDGKLYTWGRADNGQLGIGRSWMESTDPRYAAVGGSGWPCVRGGG